MDTKTIINNEYDYSNIVPTIECILYLVKYINEIAEAYKRLENEDEEKNAKFKDEYKDWTYKKVYSNKFEVYISEHNISNSIDCNDYEAFKSAVENGYLKNIRSMKLNLNIFYKRGKGQNLDYFENKFIISFEPYNIKFIRKSNNNDETFNEIEKNLKEILDKFPKVNTIFYTKE